MSFLTIWEKVKFMKSFRFSGQTSGMCQKPVFATAPSRGRVPGGLTPRFLMVPSPPILQLDAEVRGVMTAGSVERIADQRAHSNRNIRFRFKI
jgi:hypothetical protein